MAADAVAITLEGEIPPGCEAAAVSENVTLDMDSAGRQDLSVSMSCNAAFEMRLESANGGLRHTGAAVAPAGFAIIRGYSAQASVLDDAGVMVETPLCLSSQLAVASASCSPAMSSSSAIARQAGIVLRWTGVDPLPPLAGTYADTLTLKLRIPL